MHESYLTAQWRFTLSLYRPQATRGGKGLAGMGCQASRQRSPTASRGACGDLRTGCCARVKDAVL
jgi:hypothetical protein